jgi:phage tail sheath protein FI
MVEGQAYELEVIPRVGIHEDGERFYASIINRDSRLIRVRLPEDSDDFPESLFRIEGESRRLSVGLAGGSDGSDDGLMTKSNIDKALAAMDVFDDVNMILLPGEYNPDLQEAAISYAGRRSDVIFIADCKGDVRNRAPRDIQLADVKEQLKALQKDSHTALYFPWIEIADPYSTISGATRFAPPSGAIAGLYARIDNRRGVWKAPAGTEATIFGAVGVAVPVTDNDQEALNPIGVNCIRQFPDAGIVCWGSRTIATRQNPEYRYVSIRRYAMFLAKSLYRGTQWVVFEPNDEPLWSAIRFNLNAFMLRQFRSGALQGGKPEEAYFVKCDAENNPQASIDAGQVHITVAFAPLKPAEFVIIHLTQMRKE